MSETAPLLRAVLDTNVFISGTILSRGVPYSILEVWRRSDYILVTSEAIIAEVERVLHYPHIRDHYGITDGDVEKLITSLRTDALVIAGNYEVRGVSADPDDDKFLACALEAGADCIVTGDPDLLDLGQYQRVNILSPRAFINLPRP